MSDYRTPPALLEAIGVRIYEPTHAPGAWPILLPESAVTDWIAVLANPPFTGGDTVTDAPNYYKDALHDANRGAVMEDVLDALQAAQCELDALRWQIAQADGYGGYMRQCPHPIPFAEWCERQRAMEGR